MNPVYEDINMKIKLWEEEIIPCYLTEKEEKKNLMPSSRIVFEISELTHYKKLWIMCGWGYPFIVLVRESLIATKTHLVKTRLTRKRSQNKEEFLYEGRV